MSKPDIRLWLISLVTERSAWAEERTYLEDAFDALALGVVPLLAVQLPVRVADELQQPLGLDVDQHRVLQGTAVLRQGLQTALSDPLLRWRPQGRRVEKGQTERKRER